MNCTRIAAVATTTMLSLTPMSRSADALGTAPIECGATITTDTTLTHDLVDCPGIGLIIGADDVTLDLNGHLVDGDGIGDAEGVQVKDRDHVVVKNGSIRDFVEGVAVVGAVDARIWDVHVSSSRHVGIFVYSAERVRVRDSSVVNGPYAGFFVGGSSDVVLADNLATHNGAGIDVTDVRGARVTTNLVVRNDYAGIIVESNRAVVQHNTIRRSALGVVIFADRVRVAQNYVVQIPGCVEEPPDDCNRPPPGPCPTCVEGVGISVEGGKGNLIRANVVRRTRIAGIRVATFVRGNPTEATTVTRNRVHHAGSDGILISLRGPGAVGHVLIERNHALESGDDGIDVRSADTTVAANVAIANENYGITAVRGAFDGGANRARGNGGPLQCRNIGCATSSG